MRARAGAAVVVVLAVVAGCANGTGDGQGTTSGRPTGAIRVQLSGGEGEVRAVEQLVEAFEKAHPGTEVTTVPVPSQGEHIAKLATSFAAGNPPDVFLVNYRRFGSFARPDVIDPVRGDVADQLYPSTVSAFTKDGRLLCLPQNASSLAVYVNPALFAQAKVALPAPEWTWDDMLYTARALAAAGVEAIGFDTSLIRIAPFAWTNGGEIVDDPDDPTKVSLGSSGTREAIRFLLALQETGLDATQRAAQDPEDAFAAGQTAMFLDSRRAVPNLRKTEGLEFDVAPLPGRSRPAVNVLHSDGYCVAARSSNKALAHAFAEYAVSPEGATLLARTGRTVPSVRAVAESPAFLDPESEPRSSQVFLDAIPTLRPMPGVAGWHEAEEVAEDILTQLFAGRLTLDDAIERIERDTATVLAQER